jgi:hypothetical protein
MVHMCSLGRPMQLVLALVFVVLALGLSVGCDSGTGANDKSPQALEMPPGPPDQTNTKSKVKRR